MSKILVDTIDTRSGTTTLTLGSTNAGTIALGSGDVQSNFLYPAFSARATSDHALSNNTFTKLQYNTEDYDTDSAYDTSNYRFTVPSGKAGKYLFTYGFVIGTLDDGERIDISLYVNGSLHRPSTVQDGHSFTSVKYIRASCTVDLSVGDYVEVFGRHNQGASQDLEAINNNVFQGHRIGT